MRTYIFLNETNKTVRIIENVTHTQVLYYKDCKDLTFLVSFTDELGLLTTITYPFSKYHFADWE